MRSQQIQLIQGLIRGRQFKRAKDEILRLDRAKLGRADRLQLAYLCNIGGGLSNLSIQLLHANVRGIGQRLPNATDEERAEYAHALIWVGATDEAIALLEQVDRRKLARVYRFLAWARFRQWDWSSALPLFEEASKLKRLEESDRLILKLLHASALIHDHLGADGRVDVPKIEMGQAILEQVTGETGAAHFPVQHWDAYQVLGQSYYHLGEWDRSLRYFERADAFLGQERGSLQELMTRKFKILIQMKKASAPRSLLRELAEVRDALTGLSNLEQARSCDYYSAIILRDRGLVSKLYYGSPYPALKKRVLLATGLALQDLPDCYDHDVPGRSRSSKPEAEGRLVLDTLLGTYLPGSAKLKRGHVQQRLLEALTSDLWCPSSIAQLHGYLYSGEHFNPQSSPVQVRQAIARLRRWLAKNRIPLQVTFEEDRYRLSSSTGIRLRIHARSARFAADLRLDPKLRDLLDASDRAFGRKWFGAREIQAMLGLSRATAVALLNRGLALGYLTKEGRGPRTRYRLA